MAKILFFGTCCGAEPIPGMHHSSFAIEVDDTYYWFDAGENCSRTATEMGVELLKIKSIFISHTHIDHVGGLANLIWSIKKLNIMGYGMPPEGKVSVYTPNVESFKAVMELLRHSEGSLSWNIAVDANKVSDGLIYSDEKMKVYAVHNQHILDTLDGEPLSYSYIIYVADKKIVYSGDVRKLSELEACIGDGCDVLICETGHHKVADVLRLAKENNVAVLLFTHNGREIINHRQNADRLLEESGCNAMICHDKMIYEF